VTQRCNESRDRHRVVCCSVLQCVAVCCSVCACCIMKIKGVGSALQSVVMSHRIETESWALIGRMMFSQRNLRWE